MKNQLSQTSWWSWINVGPSWNNLLSNWCCTISTGSPNFLHQLSPPQRTLKQLQKHHHPSMHKPEARRGTSAKTRASNSPQFCIPPFPDGSDPKQIGSDPIGKSVLLSLETWMLQTGLGYGTAFSLGTIGLRECGTFDHLEKLANIKCYMIPNVWDVPPTVLVFTRDRKLENTMMIDLFRS